MAVCSTNTCWSVLLLLAENYLIKIFKINFCSPSILSLFLFTAFTNSSMARTKVKTSSGTRILGKSLVSIGELVWKSIFTFNLFVNLVQIQKLLPTFSHSVLDTKPFLLPLTVPDEFFGQFPSNCFAFCINFSHLFLWFCPPITTFGLVPLILLYQHLLPKEAWIEA